MNMRSDKLSRKSEGEVSSTVKAEETKPPTPRGRGRPPKGSGRHRKILRYSTSDPGTSTGAKIKYPGPGRPPPTLVFPPPKSADTRGRPRAPAAAPILTPATEKSRRGRGRPPKIQGGLEYEQESDSSSSGSHNQNLASPSEDASSFSQQHASKLHPTTQSSSFPSLEASATSSHEGSHINNPELLQSTNNSPLDTMDSKACWQAMSSLYH